MKDKIPDKFNRPTELPQTEEERENWQKENYIWWQSHPMRYDWHESIAPAEFSKEFFEEIDSRFFGNAREYLPDEKTPFDSLIHFESLRDKDVLEIGVGNGSHAGLLAAHAGSFTGVDITDYAVNSTGKRFENFGLRGKILKLDAESLDFPPESFDLVWAWGVIHHSANTRNVLEKISRSLRKGGRAVIMVYHRGWWNYYIVGLLRALISGKLWKTKSLHKSIQMDTDGAIARYYNARDWRDITRGLFAVRKIEVMGPKTDIIPLPAGALKSFISFLMPRALNRFLTRKLRMGSFLVSDLRKQAGTYI